MLSSNILTKNNQIPVQIAHRAVAAPVCAVLPRLPRAGNAADHQPQRDRGLGARRVLLHQAFLADLQEHLRLFADPF